VKKLLVSAPMEFLPDLKEKMRKKYECTFAYQVGEKEISSILKSNDFDAWLVSPCPNFQIDGKIMDLCPSLNIISTPSTGSNHINLKDAIVRKIDIFSLKDSETVNTITASSEFTFNLMISTIRKTPYAFQGVKNGEWRESEGKYRGRELSGLTLGIIGFGRIGSNLARYSLAFRMIVLAYDPYVQISNPDVTQCNTLSELLPKVDVVVVCVHLNDETFGMIDGNIFEQMKDGVYFINTSRGDVVNETDFISYLMKDKILAAGVDVISDEFTGDKNSHPLIQYSKSHDNLIITPHIAGLTYDSERKAQMAAYEEIVNYLNYK